MDKTSALALLDKGVLCEPHVCRHRERGCDCTDMAAYIRSLSAEVKSHELARRAEIIAFRQINAQNDVMRECLEIITGTGSVTNEDAEFEMRELARSALDRVSGREGK